jgi:hypothetical protein
VTAHYIDDEWKLFKRIIKFTLVESPHDGRTMFNALLRTLEDWNIENKVFSITLDNAFVNDNLQNPCKSGGGDGDGLGNHCGDVDSLGRFRVCSPAGVVGEARG